MLVVTRRKDESVMIGDDVEVTIVAVSGGQVKLGFTCPRSVEVLRKELWLGTQQGGSQKELHKQAGRDPYRDTRKHRRGHTTPTPEK